MEETAICSEMKKGGRENTKQKGTGTYMHRKQQLAEAKDTQRGRLWDGEIDMYVGTEGKAHKRNAQNRRGQTEMQKHAYNKAHPEKV